MSIINKNNGHINNDGDNKQYINNTSKIIP